MALLQRDKRKAGTRIECQGESEGATKHVDMLVGSRVTWVCVKCETVLAVSSQWMRVYKANTDEILINNPHDAQGCSFVTKMGFKHGDLADEVRRWNG